MSIPIKHKTQNQILEHLNKKVPSHNYTSSIWDDTETPHTEIAIFYRIDDYLVVKYHESLVDRKFITCQLKDGIHYLKLQMDGRMAYLEDTLIEEGRKISNDKKYDVVKWSMPLLAVLVSLGTLIFTIVQKNKTDTKLLQLESKIEHLKK